MTDPYREPVLSGCPACGAALRATGERLCCDTCNGILIGERDLATTIGEHASVRFVERTPRTCPRCQRVMTPCRLEATIDGQLVAVDTELDRCDAHGVWFDAGELAKVSSVVDPAPERVHRSLWHRLFHGRERGAIDEGNGVGSGLPGALADELAAAGFGTPTLDVALGNWDRWIVARRERLELRATWGRTHYRELGHLVGGSRVVPDRWVLSIHSDADAHQPWPALELAVWPRASLLCPPSPSAVFSGASHVVDVAPDLVAAGRLMPGHGPLPRSTVDRLRGLVAPRLAELAPLADLELIATVEPHAIADMSRHAISILWPWTEGATTVERVARAIEAWRGVVATMTSLLSAHAIAALDRRDAELGDPARSIRALVEQLGARIVAADLGVAHRERRALVRAVGILERDRDAGPVGQRAELRDVVRPELGWQRDQRRAIVDAVDAADEPWCDREPVARDHGDRTRREDRVIAAALDRRLERVLGEELADRGLDELDTDDRVAARCQEREVLGLAA